MRVKLSSLVVLGSLVLAGCGDSVGPGSAPQFSQQITIDQLEDILAAGVTRVEIEVTHGIVSPGVPAEPPFVASEVEVKGADELTDEEEIESQITGLDETAGTLELALAGLQVMFNAATEFERDDSDELTRSEFIGEVQAALDAGTAPPVEAERPAPTQPQAPTESEFLAAELELEDGIGETEFEVNVDSDNLLEPGEPGCPTEIGSMEVSGCLQVLGLVIAIVEGVTELEAEMPEIVGEVDFEGFLESVDFGDNSVTLTDGTVIRLVVGTDIELDLEDDGSETVSVAEALEAVDAALDAGQMVEADGEGVVTDSDPLTITAIEVDFELEDEEIDLQGTVKPGSVVANDDGTGSFTLVSGIAEHLVRVGTNADIDQDSGSDDERLESLAA